MCKAKKPIGAVFVHTEFNEYGWHDANLLALSIDRSDPGNLDEVTLKIEWPDGDIERLVFFDCWEFEAQMNFGILANESILSAGCVTDSERLSKIRSRWQASGAQLSDLKCFEIRLNSTGSILRIYAMGLRSEPVTNVD